MASVVAAALLLVGVFTAAIGFAPRETKVAGSELLVRSWFRTFRFDLRTMESVEEIEPELFSWRNTLRAFAVGWPLKPYGWFWNRDLGVFLALVSDRSRMVLLRTARGALVVSPENRRELLLRMQDSRRL